MANCKCGNAATSNKKREYVNCQKCKAIAHERAWGGKFTMKEMVSLIEGESIYKRGLVGKDSGKEYSSWVFIDFEAEKKRVVLDRDRKAPAAFTCHINNCGGEVFETGLFSCSSCNRKSKRTQGGRNISFEEQERLFNGETITLTGLVSKDKIDKKTGELAIYDGNIKIGDEWAGFVFEEELVAEDLEEKVDVDENLLGGSAQPVEEGPEVEATKKPIANEADDAFPDDEANEAFPDDEEDDEDEMSPDDALREGA